jgi:hypothetical protein
MLNYKTAGVATRLHARSGAVGNFLVLPDPTDDDGDGKISTDIEWSGAVGDGTLDTVTVRAFDGVLHGTEFKIPGDTWRGMEAAGMLARFYEGLMRSLDAEHAIELARAGSGRWPEASDAPRVAPSDAYYQLRSMIHESDRDVWGYPMIRVAGQTLRARTEIEGMLVFDNDFKAAVTMFSNSSAQAEVARLLSRAARRSMAERFINAYDDWENVEVFGKAPNVGTDFADWVYEQGYIGDGPGQFGMISNWELKPDSDEGRRTILNYGLMDFADGSMTVRRNFNLDGGAERYTWLVAVGAGRPLNPQLVGEVGAEVVEACRELSNLAEAGARGDDESVPAHFRDPGPGRVVDALYRARAAVAAADELGMSANYVPQERPSLSDDQIREMWRAAGGELHGPLVETATMPEDKMLGLIREVAARAPAADAAAQIDLDDPAFQRKLRDAMKAALRAECDGSYFEDTSHWSLEAVPGTDEGTLDPVGGLIERMTENVLAKLRQSCGHDLAEDAAESHITINPGESLWFDCGDLAVNVSRGNDGEVSTRVWPQQHIVIVDAPIAEMRTNERDVRERYGSGHRATP